MIKVAVICKSIYDSSLIKETLIRYDIKYDLSLNISCFDSNGRLLREYSKFNRFNLIFICIGSFDSASDISGIELAGKIRNCYLDETAELVFISDTEVKAVDTIKLKPFDYLISPLTESEVTACIDRFIIGHCSCRSFRFIKNRMENTIMISRIRYIQSSGKHIIIHTFNENIEIYGKISELMNDECFRSFILIHKSFLVNPVYIEQFSGSRVFIYGSEREELPISKNRQEDVKKKLLKI